MGLRLLSFVLLVAIGSSPLVGAVKSCKSSVQALGGTEFNLESQFVSAVQDLVGAWERVPTESFRTKALVYIKIAFRVGSAASILAKSRISHQQRQILSNLSWKPNYWEMRQSTKNSFALMVANWNSRRATTQLPALVAFSFLHPLVDGPLDRGEIPLETIDRIRQKLSGKDVKALSAFETDLFRVLEIIEDAYPLEDHPRLRWLLVNLFDAQLKSIQVQRSPASPMQELLASSLRKGGLCLALSTYIAQGNLSDEEFIFAIKEGGVLQLLDDLGDAMQDRNEGIRTVFTENFGAGNSREIVGRIVSLQQSIAVESPRSLIRMNEIAMASLWPYLGRMARFDEQDVHAARTSISQYGWIPRSIFEASYAIHRRAFQRNLPRLMSESRSFLPQYMADENPEPQFDP